MLFQVVNIVTHLYHLVPDQGDLASSPEKVPLLLRLLHLLSSSLTS